MVLLFPGGSLVIPIIGTLLGNAEKILQIALFVCAFNYGGWWFLGPLFYFIYIALLGFHLKALVFDAAFVIITALVFVKFGPWLAALSYIIGLIAVHANIIE